MTCRSPHPRLPRVFCDETPMPVIEPGRNEPKPASSGPTRSTIALEDRAAGGRLCVRGGRGKNEIADNSPSFRACCRSTAMAPTSRWQEDERTAGEIRLAFCVAHARRKFVTIHK